MPLMPKRVKYRKSQRGRIRGKATQGNTVAFGEYGLQALEPAMITARQIEAGRVAMSHFLAHTGKIYIRIFPHKAMTSIPAETRMGKGKGDIDYWCARVKPGTVMYEIGGIPEEIAQQALARCAYKMPIKCRMVSRVHKI
ncbi:MAG: 50S ribosomal protein L16 [Planctomycetota bacterium]|nr:MAG: 50S ribosomal protein L16 [Planctomycetota bacterium]